MPRYNVMATVDAQSLTEALRAFAVPDDGTIVFHSVSVYEEGDSDHAEGQAE